MLRRGALGLIALCLPQLALAHSPIAGIAKFYGGFLHPLLVLSHALALLAITLLCGLLVALQVPLPFVLYAILGAGLGLLIGIDSGVTDYTRQETFAALLGTWLGAAVALVAVAGVVELLVQAWQRVAARVLGSWCTASAVLVLALALR